MLKPASERRNNQEVLCWTDAKISKNTCQLIKFIFSGFIPQKLTSRAFLKNCFSMSPSFYCVKLLQEAGKNNECLEKISSWWFFNLVMYGTDVIQRFSKAELTFAGVKTAVTFLVVFVPFQSYWWLIQPLIHARTANMCHCAWKDFVLGRPIYKDQPLKWFQQFHFMAFSLHLKIIENKQLIISLQSGSVTRVDGRRHNRLLEDQFFSPIFGIRFINERMLMR